MTSESGQQRVSANAFLNSNKQIIITQVFLKSLQTIECLQETEGPIKINII